MRPYFRWRTGGIWVKNFDRLKLSLDPDRPTLMYCNHTSWYDGFALMRLHQELLADSALAFPMIEHEWRQRTYFSYLGAIPISPSPGGTRHAFQSFKAFVEHHGRRALILYLPQGRIWPSTGSHLHFRRGLESLLKQLPPLQCFPVGIQFEMLTTPYPQLFLTLGQVFPSPANTSTLEQSVMDLLASTRQELETHGEDFPRQPRESWQKWNW